MKALSIRQPWAWLIVNGYKDIENRIWPSHYTGELYIHASRRYDTFADFQEIKNRIGNIHLCEKFIKAKMLFGGIIGKVKMVDCVSCHTSVWFEGEWGFVFKDPEIIPFIRLKGELRIFNWESK